MCVPTYTNEANQGLRYVLDYVVVSTHLIV